MASGANAFSYARYTEDVWNCHNPDALAMYLAPDARVHSMVPGNIAGAGLDYLKGRAQALFKAFPDIHFVIERPNIGDFSAHNPVHREVIDLHALAGGGNPREFASLRSFQSHSSSEAIVPFDNF